MSPADGPSGSVRSRSTLRGVVRVRYRFRIARFRSSRGTAGSGAHAPQRTRFSADKQVEPPARDVATRLHPLEALTSERVPQVLDASPRIFHGQCRKMSRL